MPKYTIESSETVYYTNTIEANSKEEAQEIFLTEGMPYAVDYCNFQIDDIYEEGTNY
jgi:hypothetical protein